MKTVLAVLLICGLAFAEASGPQMLLNAVTTTGAGTAYTMPDSKRTFEAFAITNKTTGGSAIVKVQVSNDSSAATWMDMCTITLSLTSSYTSDGCNSVAPWKYVRGNVSSLSGQNGIVYLNAFWGR